MKRGIVLALAIWLGLAAGVNRSGAQSGGDSDTPADPSGNAGSLKPRVETAGGYNPHNGNASRSVTDIDVPGAIGSYGLDFTRHWNSTHESFRPTHDAAAGPFASGGWTHSWSWTASYDSETKFCDGETTDCFGLVQTVIHSITVKYPDGRTAKFVFAVQYYQGDDTNYTPPFPAAWGGHAFVDDHLREMNPEGTQFWLYLVDGGSVYFEEGPRGYAATKVIDPHGLTTNLQYDQGDLIQVTGPDNRSLQIQWQYLPNLPTPVISAVQGGTGEGFQRVEYFYSFYPSQDGRPCAVNGGYINDWYALTRVEYIGDLDPNGQQIKAVYTYTPWISCDSFYPSVPGRGPLLTTANDPRFAGPMTRISYVYLGGPGGPPFCQYPDPQPVPGSGPALPFAPFPIEQELSSDTGAMVARLSLPCNGTAATGTRTEHRGAGGSRKFYYGTAGGLEPGTVHEEIPNGGDYWYPPEANPGGGVWGYNAGFELTKLTDFADNPATAPWDFHHNHMWHPWRIFDARGTLVQYTYQPSLQNPDLLDGSSKVKEIWYRGSDGSKQTFDWVNPTPGSAERDALKLPNTFNHWLFSQTDERGTTTTYVRDHLRRLIRTNYYHGPAQGNPVAFEEFTYNSLNQVESHKLASGAVRHFEHDASGRLEREWNSVDGEIAAKVYSYKPGDPDRVWRMQDGRARHEGKDFTVEMTYNKRHQTKTVLYPSTGGAGDPNVSYEYDAYGNCTAITNELGQRSEFTYDPYRRCTSYTEPLNARDWTGTGLVLSRTWNWVYDRVLTDNVTVPDASTHTSNKWRLQYEPPYDAAGNRRVTARHYDYNDRLSFEYVGIIAPPTGAWDYSQGANHSYTYDGNGNKERYTDPLGRVTTYEYDKRDRLIKTNETIYTLPRITTITYDVTGNKTSVTLPDTPQQQWLDYDPFGQAWQFIDERGNITNLTYQWGPMKKLDTVTTYRTRDPGSGGGVEPQPTNFDYDGMGRPQWTIFPDGSSELTTYLYGQMDAFKTRKNQTKRIHYDARGREDSHTWDSDAAPRIDRAWDDANRLASITNIFSSIDYGYDAAGQVIWEGNDIAGSGGRTQTNYFRYPSGEVAHLYYPGGTYLRRDYTARGQLAATGWDDEENNWWPGSRLAAYTYLQDGKVDKVDYGNGTTSDRGYNGRGFISSIYHKATASGAVFASHTYTRDTRDRITSLQKQNGRGDRFRYDDEGQLIEAWYNAANPVDSGAGNTRYDGFGYDELGNRMGSSFVANRGPMTFERKDNGLNQYRAWWPYAYTSYDDDIGGTWGAPGAANGVLMQEGNITAGYNALNQPMMMQGPVQAGTSAWVWFGFDPLGRCVKRWVSDSGDVYSNPATYLHYDGWNLLQEGNNAWGPSRVYAHGNRVDEVVWSYNTFTGEQAFHHYDARGHCTLLTDSLGGILEQYEYDAFGRPYFYDAAGTSIGSYDSFGIWQGYSLVGNRFLFTGREWLGDLRLYDFRNRLYQPELGRFLQPDPKQFAAGDYNLYRYCGNDPVNRTDPMGEKWDVPDSIRADFDAARAYLSADPGMKAIFDRIDAAPNVIHVVPTESLSINPDQFQGTNFGNGSFEWNPRAGALFPNGEKQSPAMVLGHEAAHPDRFITDKNGYISDVSPAARDRTYGNREERRVIEKIETPAAKRLGEGVRDSAKARFYKTEGVISRNKVQKK